VKPFVAHSSGVRLCSADKAGAPLRRVLAADGAFFSITFTQPHFRCGRACARALCLDTTCSAQPAADAPDTQHTVMARGSGGLPATGRGPPASDLLERASAQMLCRACVCVTSDQRPRQAQ